MLDSGKPDSLLQEQTGGGEEGMELGKDNMSVSCQYYLVHYVFE